MSRSTRGSKNVASLLAYLIVFSLIMYSLPIVAFFGIIGLCVYLYVYRSQHCSICSTLLKRVTYIHIVKGEKKKICRYCNEHIERQNSRRAHEGNLL
jgi:hypothetical protein